MTAYEEFRAHFANRNDKFNVAGLLNSFLVGDVVEVSCGLLKENGTVIRPTRIASSTGNLLVCVRRDGLKGHNWYYAGFLRLVKRPRRVRAANAELKAAARTDSV